MYVAMTKGKHNAADGRFPASCLVIGHTGLLKLLFTEKKAVILNLHGFSHFFGDFMTRLPAVSVDHGIEVVGPVPGRRPLIAMGHFPKIRQGFSHAHDPLFRHHPCHHGIGPESRLLVAKGRPETSEDAFVPEGRNSVQEFFFGNTEAFSHQREGPFVEGKVRLYEVDDLFVQFIDHVELGISNRACLVKDDHPNGGIENIEY